MKTSIDKAGQVVIPASIRERAGLVAQSVQVMAMRAVILVLAGRKEDAIGHLRVALDGRPSLRDFAKEDTDLDALRDEPAFRELVG